MPPRFPNKTEMKKITVALSTIAGPAGNEA